MRRTKNTAVPKASSSSRGQSKVKGKRPRQQSPEEEYNSSIFTSKVAEERYDKISSRSVIPEWGFSVSTNNEIGILIRNSI